jgi:hypothetical protein
MSILDKISHFIEKSTKYNKGDYSFHLEKDVNGNKLLLVGSGYKDDVAQIISDLHDEFSDFLCEKNIDIVFDSEYNCCSKCNSYIFIEDDFVLLDEDIYCIDCVKKDESLKEDYLNSNTYGSKDKLPERFKVVKYNVLDKDYLLNKGFEDKGSYEYGLHFDSNTHPKDILKDVTDNYREFVFYVDSLTPFQVDYTLMARK